jgi:hypothetical protein
VTDAAATALRPGFLPERLVFKDFRPGLPKAAPVIASDEVGFCCVVLLRRFLAAGLLTFLLPMSAFPSC